MSSKAHKKYQRTFTDPCSIMLFLEDIVNVNVKQILKKVNNVSHLYHKIFESHLFCHLLHDLFEK